MVKVIYLERELIIEDMVWRAGEKEDRLSDNLVKFLQAKTDPNTVSGAEPIPDLAIAQAFAKELDDFSVTSFDQPDFDPNVVY